MRVPVKSFRLGPAQAWSVTGGGGFHYSSWGGKGKAEMLAKNCRDLEDSLRRSNIPAWVKGPGRGGASSRCGRGLLFVVGPQRLWQLGF